MAKALRADRFRLGVCYYPEHWPEGLWADDFRRMREMGLSVVRMAEFAWSLMEPLEGQFEWEFWDRAMALADQHGLKVILGTPTATPPAWLSQNYPEILNATQNGVVFQHGQRRHYNYSAPVYRELSERIADRMAEQYHSHPALLGWQIDNELNCEVSVFYSAEDQKAFRVWLQSRYGTLKALNDAWGAVFWNQTYTDWEQVTLTGPTPSNSPNPHQALDEKRFISDSVVSYAKLQADAIRRHDKVHFITTQGLFGHVDSHYLTEEALDFLSYDAYPNFLTIFPDRGEEPIHDRIVGRSLSEMRDISPQFCVMEQQSGPGGWVNRMEQPSPKPGQMRLWTYQSIAHGADMVLYFRWRTATMGTEIYWHGINDYHNQPNRRCAEAALVGSEVAKLDGLAGSRYVADVAILRDYDNEWDGEFDGWYGPYARQSTEAWFKALQRRHVPADVVTVRPGVSLSPYKVVVYPHPAILTEATAALLKEYVDQGGTVVFGCRTGYKDERGQCPMRPFPGLVADLCGVTVDEFTRIGPLQESPGLNWPPYQGLKTGGFNDVLAPGTATVLATYAGSWYAGKPALTRNEWGEGAAYAYGGVFTPAMAEAMIDHLGLRSPVAGEIPREVELAIRETTNGNRFLFLLNYTDQPQTVSLCGEVEDVLRGGTTDAIELAAFDVAVLRN